MVDRWVSLRFTILMVSLHCVAVATSNKSNGGKIYKWIFYGGAIKSWRVHNSSSSKVLGIGDLLVLKYCKLINVH